MFIFVTLVNKSKSVSLLFSDIVALKFRQSSVDYLCSQCTINDMKYLQTIAMIEFEMFILLHWLPDIFL